MPKSKIPTESQEQIDLIQWTKRNMDKYPELEMLFAIPNGGKRHIATASRMKLEGVKPGVADLFLSVARKGYHGLYIEMKRLKGGSLSKEQKDWRDLSRKYGYAWVVAKGSEQAKTFIRGYLNGQ